MKRFALFLIFGLAMGSLVCAQDSPKAEITGYYSYFRFNPENSGTLSSHSLNGGGADVTYFFSRLVGIKAEFGGYQSNSVTYTNGSTVATALPIYSPITWDLSSSSAKNTSSHSLKLCLAEPIRVSTATFAKHWKAAEQTIRATKRSIS